MSFSLLDSDFPDTRLLLLQVFNISRRPSAFAAQGVQIRRLSEVCDEPHKYLGWARLRTDHNAWTSAAEQPATQRAIRAALRCAIWP